MRESGSWFVIREFGADPLDGFGDGEGRDVGIRVGAAVYYYAEFGGHGVVICSGVGLI